ncbi:MAG: ThiF family adenylyltransferase [Candidatus Methanomethylicaceae archaeon]
MGDGRFWRQMDIVPAEKLKRPITVIGCGGIGSPTTLALAKLGCEDITVIDPDIVELHNVPNQIFGVEDIGRLKVESLHELVRRLAGTTIKTLVATVGETPMKLRGIVISGVDSMASRKSIWDLVKFNVQVPLYIDARMGGEVCRIFTLNPARISQVEKYEKTLYTDEEAAPEKCTARAVIYNVFSIAGLIGNLVKKFAMGESLPFEIILDHVNMALINRE